MQLFSYLESNFYNSAHFKNESPGKRNNIAFSTYLNEVHVFISPSDFFFLFTNFAQKKKKKKKKQKFIAFGFSLAHLLVLILTRAILEQSVNYKIISKI